MCAKLRIDYATVKKLKSDVIYCAISGFGQTGPLAPIPGHDLVVQAMTGILQPARDGGAFPLPHFQAADYAAATMACISILTALLRRNQTGEGCYIDLSMFDSLMSMANISLLSGLSMLAGGSGKPALEVWGGNPRYCIYETKDGGHVAVCLLEAKLWSEFCRASPAARNGLRSSETSPSRSSSVTPATSRARACSVFSASSGERTGIIGIAILLMAATRSSRLCERQ